MDKGRCTTDELVHFWEKKMAVHLLVFEKKKSIFTTV